MQSIIEQGSSYVPVGWGVCFWGFLGSSDSPPWIISGSICRQCMEAEEVTGGCKGGDTHPVPLSITHGLLKSMVWDV